MKKVILVLLLLAALAVASWYFFPEKVERWTQGIITAPDRQQPVVDVPAVQDNVYTGVVRMPAHMPEQPVAEVEDANYEDVSEVVGADIFVLVPGSTMGWVRRDDGIAYPGTLAISEGRMAVKDGEVVAGAFVLDMASIVLDEPNEEVLADIIGTDYLDISAYPEATFILQEVLDDKVVGVLTLKGVSKQVTFPALVITTEEKIRIFSDFSIDRTEWGIIHTSPTINIYLDLHIEWIMNKVS